MNTFSQLRLFAGALTLAGASLMVSSCSNYSSPARVSQKINTSHSLVFSSNDQANPKYRVCTEVGVLPERARRALTTWLEKSELQQVSFAYAQYYIEVIDSKTNKPAVWALISDAKGNLLGVLITKSGKPAWDLPRTTDLQLYVYQGPNRDALSRSIMNSLADAGYDAPRINARVASGLTEDQYLISKPAAIVTPAPAPAPAATATEDPAPAAEEASDEVTEDEVILEDESADDDFSADEEEVSEEEVSVEEVSEEEVTEEDDEDLLQSQPLQTIFFTERRS